jgi:hypothetical protein
MAKRKSSSFLPKFLQTTKNEKFLHSTLDQLLNSKSLERVDGYVGRRSGPSYSITDPYIGTVGSNRLNYQLEPSIVYKNNDSIEFVVTYDDVLNNLSKHGGNITRHDRLFSQEYYNWSGFVDYDKLINFGEYYWLPEGPGVATVSGNDVPVNETYTVNKSNKDYYRLSPTYGDTSNPTIYLVRGGSYTFEVNQTSGFWIQSEPGISGQSAISFNRSTRDVYGVVNNGTSNGTVTFNVPKTTDQNFFTQTLVNVANVDLASELTYQQVHSSTIDQLQALGGIDGQYYLENKTIVFTHDINDEDAWGTSLTEDQKYSVYRILVNGSGMITLLAIQTIANNQKVQIQEGQLHSTKEYYRTSTETQLQVVPAITAPSSTLYYQDDTDSTRYGVIKLLDPVSRIVDVENDILGKMEYTSANGVEFTNGLHITFDNTVTPNKYRNGTYIVDGVGEGIILINVIDHQSFELESTTTKDYITIRRGSADKNAWSRSNHWYHREVVDYIAELNNTLSILDQNERASRPIIEFNRNLSLYNHGSVGKSPIDLVDTNTTDALSNIQNSNGYIVDGVQLQDGMRIIFTADTNYDVRDKIWTVELVDFEDDGVSEINLIPSDESCIDGDTVVARQGDDLKGSSYYWSGENWIKSQQKTYVNQPPLFDVFDSNGYSYSNNDVYVGSNFAGSTIFEYAVGSGKADIELGFPLSYRNFSNIGDIVFNNTYSTDEFTYTQFNGSVQKFVSTGFIKKTDTERNVSYVDGWTKVNVNSTQYQEVTYIANGNATQFDIGCQPKTTFGTQPNLIVYINGTEVKTGFEYSFVKNKHCVIFNTPPAQDAHIIIAVLSDSASPYGVYQIPVNLNNNAFNEKFETITLGQMRNHIGETLTTAEFFEGSYPGTSNLRDIVNSDEYPGNILHHSAGLIYAGLFTQHNQMDFIKSIEHSASEYTKFKQKFMQAAENLDLDFEDIVGSVDKILTTLNSTKSIAFPFYHSDMLAHGTNKKIRQYTITDDRQLSYQFENTFTLDGVGARSVLVYLNDVQLLHGVDYTFEENRPAVTFVNGLLQIDDVIKIVDYNSTAGNYIPPTPTKMGMYPKFRPVKFTDRTYQTPVEMIQGHDGSLTRSYGGALDDILLELEKRIYNNIKAEYKPEVYDINDVVPGRWRNTDYSRAEKENVIARYFLKWAIQNRINWTVNDTYESDNKFTWNYRELQDKIDSTLLPGFWRGIYWNYFDTDRPHLTPWEMLGFSEEPSWWQDRYGPAPYTSGNLVLWEDLRDGKVYSDSGNYTVNELYARPDLLKMIPVNENGQLLSPWECLATGSTIYEHDKNWTIEDYGPAQSAWRKSSEWPFIVQIMNALMRPAKYFALMYNTDSITRSTLTGNIVNVNTNKQTRRTDIVVPGVDQDIVNGYSTYITNYMKFLGADTTVLKDVIQNVNVNLASKLSGYSDKKFLKVLAEQVSPNAVSENVIIPDEDYELVVTKTGPVISAPYSGVIVQRTNSGYSLYGYNTTDPFFKVIPSVQSQRVNVHEILGDRFYEYKDSADQVLTIPYGTELATPQQVFDFLIGYGRYLSALGYDFDNSTEELANEVITANWVMSGKEFVYWAKQNWGDGAVISLSPAANLLKFRRSDSMVDSLVDTYNGKTLLNENFTPLGIDQYRTKREDGTFELTPHPDSGGIYFADIKTVQYEHTLVLNNETIFNDIVYQPELGNRQNRLKLVGWRTQGWDGSLTAQGFILNRGVVDEWIQNTDYSKGDIIRYNDKLYTSAEKHTSTLVFDYSKWTPTDSFKLGLLPNWDTLGGNFESFYDVDEVNLESDANALGKSLIGYQSREYLTNLGLDDTSQVKFYQGLIREKGTRNAVDKLLRAKLDNITSDIDLYEEWAIRAGEYGGTDINRRVEIQLSQDDAIGNPWVIHNIPSIVEREEGVKNITPKQYYKAHPSTMYNWIPTYEEVGFFTDPLPYAGYAKLTDANATLFDISFYENLNSQLNSMSIGYTLYVANNDDLDWDMYYLDIAKEVATSVVASDNNTLLWTTKENHDLQPGDLIVVKDFAGGSGVHKILRSVGLSGFETTETVEGLEHSGEAVILKFNSVRYANESELVGYTPFRGWKLNDKVYIDNYNDKWSVFEKTSEYTNSASFAPGLYNYEDGNFGNAIGVNSDKTLGAAGLASAETTGAVSVYIPNVQGVLGEYALVTPSNTDIRGFGSSIDIVDNQVAIGAPNTLSDNGTVYVYTLDPTNNNNLDVSLAWSPGGSDTRLFGAEVKFSVDGSALFVGSPAEDQVYVFERTTNTSREIVQSFSGDNITTKFYADENINGKSVAIDGTVQILNTDYFVVENKIEFVSAPTSGQAITVLTGVSYYMTSVISGPSGSDFGYSIDANIDGTEIVIGAPTDTNTYSNDGAVYVYRKGDSVEYTSADDITVTADTTSINTNQTASGINWTQVQKITETSVTNDNANFGFDVSATSDFSKIFVGSPGVDRFERASGLVGIYSYNQISDEWDFVQNITRNAKIDGQQFGSSIGTNTDGTILAISAPTDIFDETAIFDNAETVFDSNSTQFIDSVDRGGNVYVYQAIGDSYIEAQKLTNTFIDTDDRFGTELIVLDDIIYVGAPYDDNENLNAGRVFEYTNANNIVFELSEEESNLVDYRRINRVFSYDKVKNEIINNYDWIDPIKGKIPGVADENIDFKTVWDPAVYANENSSTWGPDQVGKIWWDLSKVKYVYAEQSDWAYRSTFWGGVFPGSSIDVYQWVESDFAPVDYTGTGTVYNSNIFTTNTEYNGNAVVTKYYFWVKNVIDIPENHTKSAKDIADIISDPTTSGIDYVAFLSSQDIALYNINDDLRDSNTILVVDYDIVENDQLIHSEWVLLREGYESETLPDSLRLKTIDSLCGADVSGNPVPDPNLSFTEQHGIHFRPRQSMFVDRFAALKVFVETANAVFSKNTVALSRDISALMEEDPEPTVNSGEWNQRVENQEQLGFVRIEEKPIGWRVLVANDDNIQDLWSIYEKLADSSWSLVKLQSYDVKTQWEYADWYADGFDSTSYVSYRVDLKKDLVNINPAAGEIVQILNGGNWELVYWNGIEYVTVGIHNGTIQLLPSLYDYNSSRYGFDGEVFDFQLFDQEPQIETRKIIRSVIEDFFIEDLRIERNRIFQALIYYILQEQPNVDWIFKTSFVSVNHKIRALDALPYYRRDNQDYVEQFIQEAKPYHTKIREYVLNYDKTDPWQGDVTDFDVHSYYDTNLGLYRKPNGTQEGDDELLAQGVNSPYNDNQTFSVKSIIVTNGGSDYDFQPGVTITGGGGTGATARAVLDNGVVVSIEVLTEGTGYTSTPTITIGESVGTNASAYAQLGNDQLRTITTVMKFDRIRYTSDVQDWEPNTSYSEDDIISYNGEAYRAIENFTSDDTFSSDSLTVVLDEWFDNAMDRAIAYYQPTNVQPAKQLENLFYGIEYPRNKVTGPGFELEPGFGKSAFDVTPFDHFEVNREGVPVISGVVDTVITASNLPISGAELETGAYIEFDYVLPDYVENQTLLVEGVTVADILQNRFGDALLGTRPEDIDVVGGKFVDQYSSHAPEEFIPGRVFDSLDIEVYQSPTSIYNNSGLSPRIDVIKHEADGVNTKFSFITTDGRHGDNLLVYTKLSGKVQPDEFEIDWHDYTINFITPPNPGDIVDIINVGNTGENMILDLVLLGTGEDSSFTLPISADLAQQSLLMINGQKTDHTIVNANGRAVMILDFVPALDQHLHVFVFNLDPSIEVAYSHVAQEVFTIDGSTREFTLEQEPFYDAPTDAKVYVELAENRLRPAVYTYYTGDSSTTTFELTESADIDHRAITSDDIVVYIDGASNTNWSLDADDGSSARTITFSSAPATDSKIVIGDVTNAEYSISGSVITLDNSLTLTPNTKLNVTSFSNHNALELTAETFVGLEASEVTVLIGYDNDDFDSVGFDSDSSVIINSPSYTLYRTPTIVNYMWVTLNGIRLSVDVDFDIQGDKLLIKRPIASTDVLVVNQFSENVIKPRIAWRMWKDILGQVHWYRMIDDATTELSQELDKLDNEIHVKNGNKLATPDINANIPGVVFIGAERIEYWEKDGNILRNIRRGTMGTAVAFRHYVTDLVIDASKRQEVPNGNIGVWYDIAGAENDSLQYQTTQQAKFLNEFTGTVPLISVTFDQSGNYVQPGYVLEDYVEINE